MTDMSRRAMLGLFGATALAVPFIRPAHAEDAVLNVDNWTDHIGETAIADFTAERGITVVYDNFSSNEEAEARLQTVDTGYDLVLVSVSSLPRLIPAGIFQRLDRSALPFWGNLDPQILGLAAQWDEGNAYGMPYTWGPIGTSYNSDLIAERGPDLA